MEDAHCCLLLWQDINPSQGLCSLALATELCDFRKFGFCKNSIDTENIWWENRLQLGDRVAGQVEVLAGRVVNGKNFLTIR